MSEELQTPTTVEVLPLDLSEQLRELQERYSTALFEVNALLMALANSPAAGTKVMEQVLQDLRSLNFMMQSLGKAMDEIYCTQASIISKESARSSNPDDFLVVEDREKPTTWHLQVKRNGKPDHNLMGAAWSALHGGFRGNKYEGPKRTEALRKLKALYKKEKMQTPKTSASSDELVDETVLELQDILEDVREMPNMEEERVKISELIKKIEAAVLARDDKEINKLLVEAQNLINKMDEMPESDDDSMPEMD